jgi:hypothetical protein
MCLKVNISHALSWAKCTVCTVCDNAEKIEESVTLGTKVVLKEFLMPEVSLGNIKMTLGTWTKDQNQCHVYFIICICNTRIK